MGRPTKRAAAWRSDMGSGASPIISPAVPRTHYWADAAPGVSTSVSEQSGSWLSGILPNHS